MKIGIDITPINQINTYHQFRGTGFYIEQLQNALTKYVFSHEFIFFSKIQPIPEGLHVIHYPYFEPFFLTLPFFNKKKTVVTVHDLTPLVFPKFFPAGTRGFIKWQIQRYLLNKNSVIITDSFCSKEDIKKHAGIPDQKIEVIYLAVADEFRKVDTQKIEREKEKFLTKYNIPEEFILYVGDATPNKNLPQLVQAAVELNIPLVMVGKALSDKNINKNNPWNQDLLTVQQLAQTNSNIYVLGFMGLEELVFLYNIAKCLVIPSIYEGFGLPILEAMNCGCPVITTRGGSIPEVAGNAALYIDGFDKKSIKGTIMDIFYNKKQLQILSQKGFHHAKKFSWKEVALQTVKIYEKAYR